MKTAVVLLLTLVLITIASAQNNYVFGPAIRVNDDTPGWCGHYTTQRSLVCQGDTLYMVWSDQRNNDHPRIYFSKSTDAGNTWSPNLMISQDNDTLYAMRSHLSLDSSGNIYVAYELNHDIIRNRDIYFAKSTDGGSSFSVPIMVCDSSETMYQWDCAIAVDSSGQYVYVVWEDNRNVQYLEDTYLARSTDGGLTFSPAIRINDDLDSVHQGEPVVTCDYTGQNVYAAWKDRRNVVGYNWDIYFSYSTDYGQTFSPNLLINDTAATGFTEQKEPSIMWLNDIIYLCWACESTIAGGHPIYFSKSTDEGQSFTPAVLVRDTGVFSSGTKPSITADDSDNAYIAWADYRDILSTGVDVYFSYSNDGGLTFSPDVRVNDLQGNIGAYDRDATVAINQEGRVFVGWRANREDPFLRRCDIYCAVGQYQGIQEENTVAKSNNFGPTILRGPLVLPKDKTCKVFDITGRVVAPDKIKPGIYFVEVDGEITRKVVKVR